MKRKPWLSQSHAAWATLSRWRCHQNASARFATYNSPTAAGIAMSVASVWGSSITIASGLAAALESSTTGSFGSSFFSKRGSRWSCSVWQATATPWLTKYTQMMKRCSAMSKPCGWASWFSYSCLFCLRAFSGATIFICWFQGRQLGSIPADTTLRTYVPIRLESCHSTKASVKTFDMRFATEELLESGSSLIRLNLRKSKGLTGVKMSTGLAAEILIQR